MVKRGFKLLEPNDLPELAGLIDIIANDKSDKNKKEEKVLNFLQNCYADWAQEKSFINNILKGKLKKCPKVKERKALYQIYNNGYEHGLLLELIKYLENKGIRCLKEDSISCLNSILKSHLETGEELTSLFSKKIQERRFSNVRHLNRVIGSTLLVKGLEFDHVIILLDESLNNRADLYVSITRGSSSVYLINTVGE